MTMEVLEYDEVLWEHFAEALRGWTREELIRAALQEALQGSLIRDTGELEDAHDSIIWRLEGLAYEELVEAVQDCIERTGVVDRGMAWVDPHGYYTVPMPWVEKRGTLVVADMGSVRAHWVKV